MKSIAYEIAHSLAIEILKIYRILISKKEYNISKQLLRSATSIGANITEAIGAQSKADFRAKIYIAYKEARESRYWLSVLLEDKILTDYLPTKKLYDKTHILCKILGKTINTSKRNDSNLK